MKKKWGYITIAIMVTTAFYIIKNEKNVTTQKNLQPQKLKTEKAYEVDSVTSKKNKQFSTLTKLNFINNFDIAPEISEERKELKNKIGSLQNPNEPDSTGMTILMNSVMTDCNECLENLISNNKINIDQQNSRGETALVLASSGGNDEMAKKLLQSGANPNIKFNSFGLTLLMDASFEGNFTLIKELISYGANINSVDKEGKSALIYAAKEGFDEIVAYLLNSGASPSIADNTGQIALSYAQKYNHNEVIELLGNL